MVRGKHQVGASSAVPLNIKAQADASDFSSVVWFPSSVFWRLRSSLPASIGQFATSCIDLR